MDDHDHYPSHPELAASQMRFREARQDGIYATDGVAILGLSRYATPLSVYLSKVEPIEPEAKPTSLQAWLGWQLEDPLAQLYAERFGVPVPVRADGTYAYSIPHIKTHLDFIDGPDWDPAPPHQLLGTLVECKTRARKSAAWGEDGSTKVPVDLWVQCQHEMLVTGAQLCRIPVLFGLTTFHVYEVPRDDAFLTQYVAKLDDYWVDHVLARVPPELTGLPPDIEYSKRHDLTEPTLRAATPEWEAMLAQYRLARIASQQADRAKDQFETRIRDIIGEHAGLVGSFGEVWYRKQAGKRAWPVIAGVYRKMVDTLLELANPGDDPELVQQLAQVQQLLPMVEDMYTGPGTRVLDFKRFEMGVDDDD